jgi:light-regulated signal transduction histidine kinase (bacteriophytochrome)
MQTLIRDLLSYSRVMTQGRSLQPVDTRRAFDAACENLHQAIEESGVAVSVGSLPVIQADPTQMTQLFQNLLGNALKYRNERTPRIHVDARSAEKSWLFSVEDNGIGIEPQYFERIFQMFQRLHTREKYSGTGIGLAICRRIVERHGGKIWVESAPGRGSTFLFAIPRA